MTECLDGLFRQTGWYDFPSGLGSPVELIIVNDGSTDDTEAVVRKKLEEVPSWLSVRCISSPKVGLVNALELALREAAAEFIARIDVDDVCTPGRLRRQLEWMIANPNTQVLGSHAVIIGAHDNAGFGGARSSVTTLGPLASVPTHPALVHWNMLFRCSVLHPTVMFRASAVRSCGSYRGYPNELGEFEEKDAEDYDLWLRLLSKYAFKICVIC